MRIARVLLSAAVLCAVLCIVFWKPLGLPICVGIVIGSSMEPTIPPGSLVIGVRGEPQVGSVVVFDDRGSLVVHRVVYTNSTHVVTRGDACLENDPPVPIGDVLCIVVLHRAGGEVFFMATVATVAASLWYLLENLVKELRNRKKAFYLAVSRCVGSIQLDDSSIG